MSLDFPFYQRLREAQHPAARWWRVGDSLYYLGILVAVLGPTCVWPAVGLIRDAPPILTLVAGAFLTLASGILLTIAGAVLKREAYRRAGLDDIGPDR